MSITTAVIFLHNCCYCLCTCISFQEVDWIIDIMLIFYYKSGKEGRALNLEGVMKLLLF